MKRLGGKRAEPASAEKNEQQSLNYSSVEKADKKRSLSKTGMHCILKS